MHADFMVSSRGTWVAATAFMFSACSASSERDTSVAHAELNAATIVTQPKTADAVSAEVAEPVLATAVPPVDPPCPDGMVLVDGEYLAERQIWLDNLCDAVDMAADHMAAEFVADPQRALKVELRADMPFASVRDGERLRPDIDLMHCAIADARHLDDRQADAGMGDRGADRDRGGIVMAGDMQAPEIAARLRVEHFADIAD